MKSMPVSKSLVFNAHRLTEAVTSHTGSLSIILIVTNCDMSWMKSSMTAQLIMCLLVSICVTSHNGSFVRK